MLHKVSKSYCYLTNLILDCGLMFTYTYLHAHYLSRQRVPNHTWRAANEVEVADAVDASDVVTISTLPQLLAWKP